MGTKKSDFTASQTIPDTATLDFVIDGQNIKITKANFLAALGVTGTIVQAGAATGTAVLNTAGTINNIRNIEASVGIASSVSPENGLVLKTALLPANVGVQTLINETTAPKFRGILAGAGINVAIDGEAIQIAVSGVPASTKTVLVNQLSDFPAESGGIRTLEPDTEYFLTADISSPDEFVLQSNTVISGPDILIGMFQYTGIGDFFTAVDATCKVKNMQLLYLTANQCFNVSNSAGNEGTNSLLMDRVAMAGTKLGTLTSLANFQGLQSSLPLVTAGFTINGTGWTSFNFSGFTAAITTGTLFDIGTTTFDRFSVAQFSVDLAAGTTFLSGTTGSGNINASGDGSVVLGRFDGTGTILNNITEDDARWSFALNDDLADTRTDGLLSLQANAVPTVIAVAGTSVLVAGTWVVETASRMTGTTAGRLTYDGTRDAKLPITSSVTIEPVSGGSQEMSAFIAIDGVEVANSRRSANASSGTPISITIPWQDSFSTTQFVEVFVTNEDFATNVLVSSAIHRVN